MNLLETAKIILQKGIELNDSDLIKTGQEMIEKYSQEVSNEPPLKIDFTADTNLDVPIILQPPITKRTITYICENCNNEIESEKVRKKCPNCKKNKLKVKEEIEVSDAKRKYSKNCRLIKRKQNTIVLLMTELL